MNKAISFIDLFAGIGGFRIAFESLNCRCVYSNEINKYSCKTYQRNFNDDPFGDITTDQSKKNIPHGFDILTGGFPCQSFSIAGKRSGFDDTRGTLFFDVANIIKERQPKVFFLENVKGLLSHDKGSTLKTILHILRHDLKYIVPEPKVLNAMNFGHPQRRERIMIVGFRSDQNHELFQFPDPSPANVTFGSVREKNPVQSKYYLSKRFVDTLINHKDRHKKKGNGFGYQTIQDHEIANSVVCGGMGIERNLIVDKNIDVKSLSSKERERINDHFIRKMTPIEWKRLQGFPESYEFPVSDTQAYKQLGNSVPINMIKEVGKSILKCIK